jgi:hypothetical protein
MSSYSIDLWSSGARTATNPPSTTGMSLVLLRPTATATTYTVAGATQTQVLASVNGIETFTADPPIATQGGDVLASWATGFVANSQMRNCFFGSTTDGDLLTRGVSLPVPAPGTAITLPLSIPLPPPPRPGHPLLNISASLAPLTMDDCKSGGWQEFGVFKNQGECVSYVESGGNTSRRAEVRSDGAMLSRVSPRHPSGLGPRPSVPFCMKSRPEPVRGQPRRKPLIESHARRTSERPALRHADGSRRPDQPPSSVSVIVDA